LLIAFLPPKKKAKKSDLQNGYFFKKHYYYIIIYLFIILYIKQQNALICATSFCANTISHDIFPVWTPNNRAHQTTSHMQHKNPTQQTT